MSQHRPHPHLEGKQGLQHGRRFFKLGFVSVLTDSSYSHTCSLFAFGPSVFHFMHETTLCTAHLEPAFWHEEVVLDALFPELLSSVEAHGPVLIVDLPLVLITENGVGIVDLLEFLCGFRVVWVLVRMMPQRKFPRGRQEDTSCCWYSRMPESKNAHKLRTTTTEKRPEATWSNFWQVAVSLCKYTQPGSVSLSLSLIKINQNWVMAIITAWHENESTVNGKKVNTTVNHYKYWPRQMTVKPQHWATGGNNTSPWITPYEVCGRI